MDSNRIIILPKGISGFCGSAVKELSAEEVNAIFDELQERGNHTPMQRMYAFAKADRTFHALIAGKKEGDVGYFLNRFFPFLAKVQVTPNAASNSILKEFSSFEFAEGYFPISKPVTWLPSDFLHHKVDADDPFVELVMQKLSNQEFAEFAYYEPRMLAHVIFNDWPK